MLVKFLTAAMCVFFFAMLGAMIVTQYEGAQILPKREKVVYSPYEMCINGVIYYRMGSNPDEFTIFPAYNPDGSLKICEEVM